MRMILLGNSLVVALMILSHVTFGNDFRYRIQNAATIQIRVETGIYRKMSRPISRLSSDIQKVYPEP